MYEPSYLNDSYDRFDIDDSFKLALSTTDANSLHEIDNIKKREDRMFKKLTDLQTSQTSPNKDCTNCCGTDICGLKGNQRFETRNNIKKNIEDYQYRPVKYPQFDSQGIYPGTTQLTKNYPNSILQNIKKSENSQSVKRNSNSRISEAFGQSSDTHSDTDIEFLQNEINAMEKKNNNLVIFIFLLVIVVLIQFTKSNNDPVRVFMMPQKPGNNPSTNSGITPDTNSGNALG
jgi:hypothetical protein